jgi:3-deoxy-manno-octulosonate cytidylyltransferase (CMP-KDO synthetase)|tara:strand:- start:656 stop:1366 length:711 start_codon:yes stop_codon:yes gene_type:complete
MNESIYILIPSRIGSTRIKNKPLIDINGETLIQRVFKNALNISSNTYVATDSEKIKDNILKISSNVIMTSDHISGTDRIYEAANKLNLPDDTFILNLQGDEPFIPKELIYQVINDFNDNDCDVITVSTKIKTNDDLSDPNCVLVETDNSMYAKNFARIGNFTNPMRHIGIYGYSYKILNNLVNLEPTKSELEFKLEQLRFLENNYSIYVSYYDGNIPNGIDTEQDVIAANKYLQNK